MTRRLLVNALLALGSVVATMAAFDATLRLTYEPPWHRDLEMAIRIYKPKIPTNELGLRDRLYPSPSPDDHRRVLLLGDSFTFGSGVPDDDVIFPERLERRLNAELSLPGVAQVDVLNGGIAGSLTGDWLTLYREVAPRFDPDLVVAVFFLRDGTPNVARTSFFWKVYQDITARNAASPLYRFSYLYRRFKDAADRQRIGDTYSRTLHDGYFGSEKQTQEWRRAKANLITLRSLAQRTGAPTALVVFPVLIDLGDGYPFAEICDLLVDWAQRESFPVHDLREAYRGHRGPELWVSGFNQHPNARGHEIAADSLYPFVSGLLADAERTRQPRRGG